MPRPPSRSFPREPTKPETLSQGAGEGHILPEKNELKGNYTVSEDMLEKTVPLSHGFGALHQASLTRGALRPRVVIPRSISSRPEEIFLNNISGASSTPYEICNRSAISDESTVSAGTVRELKASYHEPDNTTAATDRWPRQKMHDLTVATPFQDLNPMSATWSWQERLISQTEQRDGDSNPGTPVSAKQRSPANSTIRAATSPFQSNSNHMRVLSMRPDTPVVAAGRPFLFPRAPTPTLHRATGSVLNRVADMTERPDSPKSRNLSVPIPRNKLGSVRLGDSSAADRHLQDIAREPNSSTLSTSITESNTPPIKKERISRENARNPNDARGIHSAGDEPVSGTIRISANSNILEENGAKGIAISSPASKVQSESLPSNRCIMREVSFSSHCSVASSISTCTTGLEKSSCTETRGRTKEREPWPQVTARSTSQDSIRNDILHHRIRRFH